MTYKTIIGLEIHVELSTESKMFCSCKNEFGAVPNTHVCEICLGHPGALPVMNKKALEYGVMAGIAFDCDIRHGFKMDRKKYFYPDLVKGYQITQQDDPLCEHGHIDLQTSQGEKRVRIRRIHLEEDTGKSTHTEDGKTLMDYNRSGVPLIEIVSEPDMNTPEEGRMFLDRLKETLKFIGISDVKMEEGSLRCDVNINVVEEATGRKTKISEIKNLNSFRAAVKAMEYEEKRHQRMLEEDEESIKETRRWDDTENKTFPMRKKEEGNDYRFSVEGDLPYTLLEAEKIEEIRRHMPELPREKALRYVKDYGIEAYDADILSQNKSLSQLFEKTADLTGNPQVTSNWILSDLLRRIKEAEIEVEEMKLSSENLARLIKLADSKAINNNTAKKILREIFDTNENPEDIVKERGLIQISSATELQKIVDQVLEENPQSIEDFKNGKDRALGFLVGQCMKKSKGKGNPQEFNKMVAEKLRSLA